MDSFGRLNSFEVRISSDTGHGGRGLVLSHEAGSMMMYAALLCKFWSPPQFNVGGPAFGRGEGCDEVRDLGKAVVEPAVKCVWSGDSRGGRE